MQQVGRIIAIGGGKGGVGKSLISTNLAVALAKTGARVVLLDADLGAPNLHAMFGIARPARTVEDFLAGRAATLEEVALETAVPGLRLICGAEGALGAANPSFQTKQKLLSKLGKLACDCLLIDVGAGTDLNTIDFFNAADARLVVMVPEVTSLQNGYAFLKVALFRRLQRAVAGMRVSDRITSVFGKDAFEIGSTMDRVSTFFSLLEDEVPEAVAQLKMLLAEFNASLIGNMLHRPVDGNALYAMQRLIRDRLDIQTDVVASLRQNPQLRGSINAGRPFVATAPVGDPDAFEVVRLATRLIQQDLTPLRKLRAAFLRAMEHHTDGDLDRRFQFGLEGVAAESQVVREPRPAPSASASAHFTSEVRQLQRSSERIKLYVPVEVSFDGRWYLGQLVEINEGGGCITGIRAPASWTGARGALRVAGDERNRIAVAMHRSDPPAGQVIVRFEDPVAAASLVASLRRSA